MMFGDLIKWLVDNGLTVRLINDDLLKVVGDLTKVTEPIKESLRRHRQTFLDHFRQLSPTRHRSVQIGTRQFEFGIWQGQQLGTTIAIDTETRLIQGTEIPELALASVSDGQQHYVVPVQRLGQFITQHRDHQFVAHNAAFDFWVIERALRPDSGAWWAIADQGRLHDTMLLDALLRLAATDEFPQNRDLGMIAQDYAGIPIDKCDPYRLRYGEIIGQDLTNVEPGFLSYAITDAIATRLAWDKLQSEA